MTIRLVKNDTLPILQFVVTKNGQPVNLTSSTIKFYIKNNFTAEKKIDGSTCTIVDASNGICQYCLSSNNTDTAGDYSGEVEITFADGKKETNFDELHIIIREDV